MDLPVQLQSGEEVIQVIRRHPASLWGRLALIALVIIIALVVWLNLSGDGTLGTLVNIAFILVIVAAEVDPNDQGDDDHQGDQRQAAPQAGRMAPDDLNDFFAALQLNR